MSLKARVERLERDTSRNPAPPMIWMNEGETAEEAMAREGLPPDADVIVCRWWTAEEAADR